MKLRLLFLIVCFLFTSTMAMAQSRVLQEEESLYVVVKDTQGERVEGYLRLYPEEVTVATKDNQEKSIPLKYIESIRFEKVEGTIPGADQPETEGYYSVRLQNSQEIFTLRNKYTFSLSTSVGVVTRTVDPGMVQDLFQKDAPSGIRDKSAVLSLEFKF